ETCVKNLITQYPTQRVWQCALAYLYSELDRGAEARSTMTALAAHGFTNVPPDANWLISMALLAATCSSLGEMASAATLYDLLLPYADRNVVVGAAAACYGVVAYYLGLLATTLGRWHDAAAHFHTAMQRHQQMGAWLWLAHTHYAYAHMLLVRAEQDSAAT